MPGFFYYIYSDGYRRQYMKRIITLLFTLLAYTTTVNAKHLVGGQIVYNYLGPGATPEAKKYKITLMLYTDDVCSDCHDMPANVTMTISVNMSNIKVADYFVLLERTENLPSPPVSTCIANPPGLAYSVGYYSFEVELPDRLAGYTVAYQTCCRRDDLVNIRPLNPNPRLPWDGMPALGQNATITGMLPGFRMVPGGGHTPVRADNSPRFRENITAICYNSPFELDFSATDMDGDYLSYAFDSGYTGGVAQDVAYNQPRVPPYATLPYVNGYSAAFPLGPFVSINPNTGVISGIAPPPGRYLVVVNVTSKDPLAIGADDQKLLSIIRKEFIVTVSPCDVSGAFLKPEYSFCDGLTVNLQNLSQSPLNQEYYWEFGDGNTSTEANPTYTYNSPGEYNVMLIVNRGTDCADTATTRIKMYPGFAADFDFPASTCKLTPVSFTDRSSSVFGTVNYWKWDVPGNFNSTSQHPVFTPGFAFTGTYPVTLIAGDSKGCRDTITRNITILDKAPFTLTNDTLICNIDTLQLNFVNTNPGSITWTPAYMITDVHSFTPLVSPDVTTTYYANYADDFGCTAKDSVIIRVVDRVTLNAMSDTTICLTDSLVLRTGGDGLSYAWTPPLTLSNAALQSPVAKPVAAFTSYHVVSRIGKCFTEADVEVRAAPYPAANAGPDSTICLGNSIQLHASGGSIYSWSPRIFLDNRNIADPVSQHPLQDIEYVVTVKDVLGCPKAVNDTMRVTVADIKADAGPATMNVVLGQPVNLLATGSTNYEWTPATWLSNPHVANPVALPQQSIKYTVRVSNPQGCFDTDTISLKLFNIAPDLLVPTAFSPNNDGINDIFRPIAVGMKSLNSFRIYNRWGQLLFAGSRQNDGWDGSLKGMPQAAGTYVWEATGITYQDKVVKKKGTVTLIR